MLVAEASEEDTEGGDCNTDVGELELTAWKENCCGTVGDTAYEMAERRIDD